MRCAIFILGLLILGFIFYSLNLKAEYEYKKCVEYTDKIKEQIELLKALYNDTDFTRVYSNAISKVEYSGNRKSELLRQEYECIRQAVAEYKGDGSNASKDKEE